MGLYVMSVSEMGNGGKMKNGSGDSCLSVLDDQEKGLVQEENMMVIKDDEVKKNDGCLFYASSSDSSIGKNSDEDFDNVNDEEEVQSGFNAGEVGSFGSLQALEEALPMRRGISRFYNGKAKSFTRLGDASSISSIKEIVKPENPYTRRKRNLLAHSLSSDKHTSFPLKTSGGVSKRSTNSMRNTLALAVAMTNTAKSNATRENSDSKPSSVSSLSPHYSQITQTKFNTLRQTFSFTGMEQCGSHKASAPL